MRWTPTCTAMVLALLAAPAALLAQYAQPAPTLPPALYVRLAGPAGTKVTLFRGGAKGQTFDLPCLVALRPGYRYCLELSGMPAKLRPEGSMLGESGTICPTLDVLGSLRLTGGVRASEHPATINFTEEDLATVRAGSVVTKIVLLERPETALPIATTSDQPLEITVPPNRDPLLEAQQRGRPLVVLQMGERQATPQELAAQGVPGTMLFPGESVLPPPRDPPCLPWTCFPLVDPRSGLPSPAEEICFHDGGDGGLRAGIGRDGKLVGLDPSDTVAQYVDSRGNQKLAVSNQVCLCVPRYLLIRTAIAPAANTVRTGTGDAYLVQAPAKAELQTGALEHHQDTNLAAVATRQKLSGIVNLQQTTVVGRIEGLDVFANAEGTGTVTGKCAEPVAEPIDRPLVIIKWPDKCELQLGDTVTFFIRYENQGQHPITGIVVNDSLTRRLEYVRASARADRDALFTTTPNEAGSAVLRWEITAPLPPGQSGTVSFQARVR